MHLDGDFVVGRRQISKHEFRASKHRERALRVRAPREIDKAGPLLALDGWTAKIAVDGANLGDPLGRIGVARDKAMRVSADLQSDVDVVVRAAFTAGEVMTTDD